jgi:hypothetical protein
MKSVYSAVRTGALNKAVCASALEGIKSIHKGGNNDEDEEDDNQC